MRSGFSPRCRAGLHSRRRQAGSQRHNILKSLYYPKLARGMHRMGCKGSGPAGSGEDEGAMRQSTIAGRFSSKRRFAAVAAINAPGLANFASPQGGSFASVVRLLWRSPQPPALSGVLFSAVTAARARAPVSVDVVPGGEVESPRYCYRRILSPLRLPVPPSRPASPGRTATASCPTTVKPSLSRKPASPHSASRTSRRIGDPDPVMKGAVRLGAPFSR